MFKNEAILLVANYSNNTGYAWNNIYKLFNSIATIFFDKGYSVCLSFAKLEKPVEIINKEVTVRMFVFDPYNITASSLLRLKASIKKFNIRYIYFTDMNTYSWLYFLLRLWGVRKIIVHCRISVENPMPAIPERGIKKLLKASVNRIPFLRADCIYSISDFVSQRLIKKSCYPKGRIIEIPNGVDTKKFSCPKMDKDDENIIIFCCSRATKHKGIPILIDAVEILVLDYKINDFVVQYAGDGPDLNAFKQQASDITTRSKIVFLGQLKSTHEYTCNADIVVVPSEWGEGFASTVVEGMAAGKAVVASSAGGIPEVLGGSEYGRLVPYGNSQSLALALLELIRDGDLRRRLGANARKRAQEYFDISIYHHRVTDQLLRDITQAS